MSLSLQTVKSIILLDPKGNRIYAKFYDDQFQTQKEQKTFEKSIFDKTKTKGVDVILQDNLITVTKTLPEFRIFVSGNEDENEMILFSVLNTIYETLLLVFKAQFQLSILMENLDFIMLTIDEVVDRGIILELDSEIVVNRALIREEEQLSESKKQTKNFYYNSPKTNLVVPVPVKKQQKHKKPKKQPLRLSEQARIELFGILQPSPNLELNNIKQDQKFVVSKMKNLEYDRELLPFSPPNRTPCPVIQDGYFKQRSKKAKGTKIGPLTLSPNTTNTIKK
ncbi:coat protein (coatomer) zeta [Anaeramoeba flamelloides]|uniref:Coatomer subunit zeta n=1 Tax=Anaeramoeba flamelloides TaxID=1746091 RepID=A0AAV7ZMT0_9EUKA|nr:coat protein (coatomer) zeta isoform a [Anaeramoeba flamelloides]KAJ6226988.1 coat protein (coatomer) zeta [Anaeramoeba flamelloides]